jgi:hypothetical protein
MLKYRFDHIYLFTVDPIKTSEFFKCNFGAVLVKSSKTGEGRMTINLNLGGITLLVSTAADEQQSGLAHFGIKVENLEEATEELKSNDVKFTAGITELPSVKYSFLQGPENISIELLERKG